MSEVQSRGSTSRGRGAHRGSRGGYRGSRGSGKVHSRIEEHDITPSLEDQGEVGELKIKYSDKLPLLREVCEGWSDEDLVFALQEVNGDVEAALDRITSGTISQWGEVKKKVTKGKDLTSVSETNARGRGRGGFEGRGRGRGTERVSRAGRGGRSASASQANGTKSGEKAAKTTEEAFGDSVGTSTESKPTNGDPIDEVRKDNTKDKPASAHTSKDSKVGAWAKLFANPEPAPVPKKAYVPPPSSVTQAAIPTSSLGTSVPEQLPILAATDEIPPPIEPVQGDDPPSELPSAPHSEAAAELTPSKDELTEKNLDKIPDISHPPASQTVVSTTASTQDPINPAVPTAALIRPGMSGYAASALKATSGASRTPSYSRKVMDQQEAVVMPGNHAVDRAAVQFGKMGLNGVDDEVEDEREEPETRTQLPDDSPAAPRASLPPAVPETKAPVEAAADEPSVQRPAPGLPPAPQQQPSPPQPASHNDPYRYGQGQKAYDPFTQQQPGAPATTEPFSNQVPGQTHGLPGTAQEYSQYYGGNNREAYQQQQQYYGGYGQAPENPRTGSTFATTAQDIQGQYATARPGQAFAHHEATNSGNNTPNPTAGGHQATHSQHVPGQGSYGGYPYGAYPNTYAQQYPQYGNSYMAGMSQRYGANRPMFDDVRRDNDFHSGGAPYNYSQQYGANYKSNMYGQPHQYTHDYSSSPANNTGFGGREAAYGRTGSAQPSESQQSAAASNAFGGIADPFGRTPSGFGQNQTHGSHQGSDEQPKPSGPSPSLQGNRPGSALNNVSSQQGSLPHSQSQHSGQGFGGYPQYGGFGNQSHNTGYGAYGSNAGFGGYGGAYQRGWSGNYGGGHN